ncbi:MAG: PD-(D/E)XK nuclease family protein [Elusimicrobiota bacterium]
MAVKLLSGPPASGKKAYLKSAIKQSLSSLNPEDIIVISNSRKSACELRDDARKNLGSYSELWVESITSFSKKILRENYNLINIKPGFRIISDFEKRLIVRNILESQNKLNTIKGSGDGLVSDVSNFLDVAKRNPRWRDNISNFKSLKGKYKDLLFIEEKYNSLLNKFNYMDFIDLTLNTAVLLENNPKVMKTKKVFVYEAEDMGWIMARIICALIDRASSAVVSLSPQSSIFRFRGARPLYIKNRLEKNCKLKIKSFSASQEDRKEFYIQASTKDEEAKAIASDIALKLKSGYRPSDICIIGRSIGESMEVYTDALKRKGINFILGGGIGFFRQRPIIELLSLFRCILHGSEAEEMDIVRTVLLADVLDPDKLDSLRAEALNERIAFKKIFSSKYPDESRAFYEKINSLALQGQKKSAGVFIYHLLEEFGFLKIASKDETLSSVYSYFMQIIEEYAGHYKKFSGEVLSFEKLMENFINLLKGFGKEMDIPYMPGIEAVKLITVQQAKGELFNRAYLVGMTEDSFPRSFVENSLLSSHDRRNLNLKPLTGIDEQYKFEKKLFEVARTRANKIIYSWYETENNGSPAEISSFVSERNLKSENMLDTERIVDTHDFMLQIAENAPDEIENIRKEQGEGELSEKLEFLKSVLEFSPLQLRDKVEKGIPKKYSYTMLKTFSSCPRKFFYRYILSIKEPPTVNQFLGIAIHTILEKIHRNSVLNYRDASIMLKEIWPDIGFYSLFESRNFFKIVREMLSEYYKCIKEENFGIISLEESFETNFEGIIFRGRYDRIDSLDPGVERVVDYKSGKNIGGSRAMLNAVERGDDFQVPIYYLARKPFYFSVYRLREKSEKMRVDIDFSSQRARDVIFKSKKLIKEKVKQISSGIFHQGPSSGNECRFCYFSRICDINDG